MRDKLIESVAAAWAKVGSVEAKVTFPPSKDAVLAADGATRREFGATLHIAAAGSKTAVVSPFKIEGQGYTFEDAVLAAVHAGREQFITGPGSSVADWVHALDGVERVVRDAQAEAAAPHPRTVGVHSESPF